MKIAYATDVHGNEGVYEKLFEVGKRKGIKAVVIGGDASPGFSVQGQREFFRDYFIHALEGFKKVGKPVLFIMGNDDYNINLPLIEEAEKKGLLKIIHNQSFKLEGFNIAGYSNVNDGPLIVRDWIKDEKEIEKDLAKLKPKNPEKTVYVIHAPPHNTKLDVAWSGEHVGSTAVRSFLLKEQPLASLHGHIHESPHMAGDSRDTLGKTVLINPGSENIIILDLETMRHEIV